MPLPCSVCEHGERKEIDRALVEGRSYRALATAYGVSKDAMWRHARNDLSPRLQAAQARRDQDEDDRLVARLERLYDRAEDILDAAIRDERTTVSLQALRELRGITELLGRFLGELRPEGIALNVAGDLQIAVVMYDHPAPLAVTRPPEPASRADVGTGILTPPDPPRLPELAETDFDPLDGPR